MSADYIPAEIPEHPHGWKRTLTMHMNFGSDGGAATYAVIDPDGRETCIVYQYDTRKARPAVPAVGKRKAKAAFEPAKTGFHVPGVDSDVFSWPELRAAWPDILAKIKAA